MRRVAVEVLEFDTRGNALVVRDAAGRETRYKYNALDLVTEIVSPDPDGLGPQWHPAVKFVYSKTGRLLNEILTSVDDPDAPLPTYGPEIVTRYEYDERHRLQEIVENDVQYGDSWAQTNFKYDAARPLALVCAANVARNGYANGGIPGAGDALMRDMMFVDEIEATLGPGINAAHDHFLPSGGSNTYRSSYRRNLQELIAPHIERDEE